MTSVQPFETQDRLEMGAADGSPAEVRRSGWMNRPAAEIGAGRGEVIAPRASCR